MDTQAIVTNGYWVATASELNCLIISSGYLGTLEAPPVISYIARKIISWLSPTMRHKLK